MNQELLTINIILLLLLILLISKNQELFSKTENNLSPSYQDNNLSPTYDENIDILFDEYEPEPPIITNIKKKDNNVLVKWDNYDTDNINKFMIIYKNQNNDDKSTWILRNIESNQTNNQIVLNNMFGSEYHLTILSIYTDKENNEKVSEVGKIVYFSDNQEYKIIEVEKGENIKVNNLEQNEINAIFSNNNLEQEIKDGENIRKENNKEEEDEEDEEKLLISCDGTPLDENIKTMEDLEKAEVDYECERNNEINNIRDGILNYRPYF